MIGRDTDSLGSRGKTGIMVGIKVAAASSFLARLFLAYLMAWPTLEGWSMHQLALRSLSLYLRSQLGHRAGYLSFRFRYMGHKLYKRGLTMKGIATFVIDRGKI